MWVSESVFLHSSDKGLSDSADQLAERVAWSMAIPRERPNNKHSIAGRKDHASYATLF